MNSITKYDKLPPIGFGTFGNDFYDAQTVADSVYMAIKRGYRLIDCASVYGNEKEIGEVFKRVFDEGICTRDELIVTSKVWNDMHGEGKVIKSCLQSIEDLGIGYIDIYFMHWPFPNYHAIGCSVDSRSPDSKPFFVEDYMIAWRQMEELQRSGAVKRIAMSNMTIPKFEAILPLCEVMPYAHEMELHPSFQQPELKAYCENKGMKIIGYCPLGSPNRPERDKTPDDIVDTAMDEVVQLAQTHDCHPVEICLKWAAKNGHIPIPFSGKERNIVANLRTVTENPLTDEEYRSLRLADKECRLVKGHVFLWKGAKDWTDLWDVDGKLDKWAIQGDTWKRSDR